MSATPEIDGVSIVLLGSFNPSIFQPWWFLANGLASEPQVEAAEIRLIVPEAVDLSMCSCNFRITRNRFSAETLEDPPVVRDLVAGVFSLLKHTPVRSMGLNRTQHFRVASEDEWHAIGDRLAPKDIWEAVLEGRPGLLSLTVQGARPDSYDGRVNVKIEPSAKVQHGVFFEYNDHYVVSESGEDKESASIVLEILSESWQEFMRRSSNLNSALFESVR